MARSATIDVTMISRPHLRSIIPGTSSFTSAWAARRSTSIRRTKASWSISWNGRRSRSPTLWIRISMSGAPVIAAAIAARSTTSKASASAANPAAVSSTSRGSSRARSRPCSRTLAPASARPLAISQPRPRAEPVISAVRPLSRNSSGKVDMGGVIRLLRQSELALYWRMLQLPKVIGHRGAAAYAPENTLDSFREAHRRGAAWIEIDVKLTADSVPIVMHDSSLKRTTGVDRLAAETKAADLPKSVPTFEQAIACFQELGLGCNVEIKPCEGREAETARITVETLRRCWPVQLPPPLLSSFKRASLIAAREVAPEFDRAILLGEIERNWLPRAEEVRAVGVNTDGSKLTAPRAVEICKAGYALSVYTINDGDVARALVGMGVHCVITDAPDVIIEALR